MDELIYFGGAVKALGDGKVGGYLVEFTDHQSRKGTPPDLVKEFFTKGTDYDIEPVDHRSVYFNHGQDKTLKRRKLSKAELKVDDAGIWAETILDTRDAYLAKIYEMAEAGKLGWSSGSAPHLVEKKSHDDGFVEITAWPIAEASLTHTPCNPFSQAVPLKSFFDEPEAKAVDGNALFNESLRQREMRCWELVSALDNLARKVAEGAAAESVTGVSVNVRDALTAGAGAFAPRWVDAAVVQVEEWLQGDRSESFYLKSQLDELIASGSELVSGSDLEAHSLAVVSAVAEFARKGEAVTEPLKAYVTRLKDKQEFRATKDGRVISASTREKVGTVHGQVSSLRATLKEMEAALAELMTLAEPKPKSVDESEVLGLVASFEAIKMSRTLAAVRSE